MIPLLLFLTLCVTLLIGIPVAFALAGTALLFAVVGGLSSTFDLAFLHAVPNRIFGTMNNGNLVAVPLFIFMGITLEKSGIAQELLHNMGVALQRLPAGLALSVLLVGTLLAASTGIVGATVVLMSLMALPVMLKHGYHPAPAAGIICATGTLGQIIPPSIALILLGDTLSNAYQQVQLRTIGYSADTVSVGDLFAAALVPGLMLVLMYGGYLFLLAHLKPQLLPRITKTTGTNKIDKKSLMLSLIPPILLILVVLGSIILGIATPTEASGLGALGALLLAYSKKTLTRQNLSEISQVTLTTTAMVFMILIGASIFSIVFRGYGGDELIEEFITLMPGGILSAMVMAMVLLFLLGFVLDFIEITLVVIPLVAPALLMLGLDPVWLGVMFAINLQTSFLTPPFGFSLFYFRGVAPPSIKTWDIYRGVTPFIAIQLFMLVVLSFWPSLATWLPEVIST